MIDLPTFIETLFTGRTPEDAVCLTMMTEAGAWWNTPYYPELLAPMNERPGPWYVCGSTVKNQSPIKRRLEDCTAFWTVLLDDIGTKVLEPPKIAPSVRMETSSGNEQWLYFIEPYDVSTVGELELAQGYLRELAETGFTDKASKSVSRVFRVPGSINVKPGRNNFATRVIEWEPDRVWDLEDLMREFGITKPTVATTRAEYHIRDDIEYPDDPVLVWLQSLGRLGEKSGDWYTINCPWGGGHSEGGEITAGYSPFGIGRFPLERGFQCFHEHCNTQSAKSFLAWVQEQGGPSCAVVGIRELELPTLRAALKAGNPDDRMKMLSATLPELQRLNLPDMLKDKNGFPTGKQLCTRPNMINILEVSKAQVRHNTMGRKTVFRFLDKMFDTLAASSDDVRRSMIDGCMRLGIATEHVGEVTEEIGMHRPFHPMEDWILSTVWDGKSRLNDLLHSATVLDSVLWPTYLRKWLIQCVQACCGWRNPSPMSSVLVLVGYEGRFKSQWLESLVPKQFFQGGTSLHLNGFMERDSVMKATQTPIVELGEVDTTFRRSDLGALRQFLTRTEDVYRVPYGAQVRNYPRATSYCATVNRTDFLTDPEGSRRFWPVTIHNLNNKHGIDIAQLWAEVHQWWRAGEKWWLTAEEEDTRLRAAEEFTFIPPVAELVDLHFSKHDAEEIQIMNGTMFCEILGAASNTVNVRQVKDALRHKLGNARKIKGLQNAWAVPMNLVRHHHLKEVLDDEEQRSRA